MLRAYDEGAGLVDLLLLVLRLFARDDVPNIDVLGMNKFLNLGEPQSQFWEFPMMVPNRLLLIGMDSGARINVLYLQYPPTGRYFMIFLYNVVDPNMNPKP